MKISFFVDKKLFFRLRNSLIFRIFAK